MDFAQYIVPDSWYLTSYVDVKSFNCEVGPNFPTNTY